MASTSPTHTRLLVLACAMTLLACALWLGPRHPLTGSGLIALVSGLIVGIWRSSPATPRHTLLLAVGSGVFTAWLAWQLHWTLWLAALMPALCQALLAALVWRTLRPGQTPAIERMALAILDNQQPLPAVMARYARRSTWLWCVLFAGLALLDAWLVLGSDSPGTAPVSLGALDAGVAAVVVLGEFFYRRWRHPEHNTLTLGEFVHGLRRVNPLSVLLPERGRAS